MNDPATTLTTETNNSSTETVPGALRVRCGKYSDASVLLAPGRKPLSWVELGRQLDYVRAVFGKLGLGPNSRIAVVLKDGPELATSFLAISSWATFAPLNPAYREEEFEFYLTDLQAQGLILAAGDDSPAGAVARRHGIPILRLTVVPDAAAGQFCLEAGDSKLLPNPAETRWPLPNDVALVLHTSGTTSRPKMVPLSHRNLCSSGRHIATALQLMPGDRSLCVMPLFHIHGLMGALFSSLWAGASVVCPPGFSAAEFFSWMQEFKPTWYSAVPTMHQAILARAAENADIVKTAPLRLIRSSSSALPPQVMQQLEHVFRTPVIESYGMTEASHQMASNRLPPGARKAGSVGVAAGPEVSIMDKEGNLLPAGKPGEIVIRGPNVTVGYENNPTANATAFTRGWFRTGDQGHLDADGYLFITGRLKEIINRGGEKISPREIDEVLLGHPDVRQAVAFSVPHATLGEDIAAAVVRSEGGTMTESDLREFALQRLPAFKVPSRILLVKEIPKGPTGKIQRIGMAERLAGDLAVRYEAPVGATEQLIGSIYERVLNRETVGRNDNFFMVGGDSIRAMQAVSRLREALGLEVPVPLVFHYPTPAALALELDRRLDESNLATLAAELEKLPPEEMEQLLAAARAKLP